MFSRLNPTTMAHFGKNDSKFIALYRIQLALKRAQQKDAEGTDSNELNAGLESYWNNYTDILKRNYHILGNRNGKIGTDFFGEENFSL